MNDDDPAKNIVMTQHKAMFDYLVESLGNIWDLDERNAVFLDAMRAQKGDG